MGILTEEPDHCIEMLRQVLMCSADLHLISYDWVDEVDYPWPDFSLSRNCRNYEQVHEWGQRHTLLVSSADGMMRRPAGATTRKLPT